MTLAFSMLRFMSSLLEELMFINGVYMWVFCYPCGFTTGIKSVSFGPIRGETRKDRLCVEPIAGATVLDCGRMRGLGRCRPRRRCVLRRPKSDRRHHFGAVPTASTSHTTPR